MAYILDGNLWTLTSRGFRTCMTKWGRESLRPSYDRPKLTLVSRFFSTKCRCKKLNLLQCSCYRSEINRMRTQVGWVHLCFRAIARKFAKVLILFATAFFCTQPLIKLSSHFEPLYLGSGGPGTQAMYIVHCTFSESWVHNDSVGTS